MKLFVTESDQKKLAGLKAAEPVDVERTKLRQQILTLSSQRVDLLRAYVVSLLVLPSLTSSHPLLWQKLMHEAIQAQQQATCAGLEQIQVSANIAALRSMCQEQEDEINKAKDELTEREDMLLASSVSAFPHTTISQFAQGTKGRRNCRCRSSMSARTNLRNATRSSSRSSLRWKRCV